MLNPIVDDNHVSGKGALPTPSRSSIAERGLRLPRKAFSSANWSSIGQLRLAPLQRFTTIKNQCCGKEQGVRSQFENRGRSFQLIWVVLLVSTCILGVRWYLAESVPNNVSETLPELGAVSSAEKPPHPEMSGDSALEEIEGSISASVALLSGHSSIEGVVWAPDGMPASGAQVKLFQSRLPASLVRGEAIHLDRILPDDKIVQALSNLTNELEHPWGFRVKNSLSLVGETSTDASGLFAFDQLPPGEYVVVGQLLESLFTPTKKVIFLEEESVRVEVSLIEGKKLRGRVLDSRGLPVESAHIALLGDVASIQGIRQGDSKLFVEDFLLAFLNRFIATGITDSEGVFEFNGFVPCDYRIYVDSPPWARAEERIAAEDQQECTIVLELGGSLRGQVVDRSGSPIPGMAMRVSNESAIRNAIFESFSRVVSGEDGSFQFEGLPPASYRLEAKKDGWCSKVIPGLYFSPGDVRDLEITVDRGARIQGVVLDPAGLPVSGLDIEARRRPEQRISIPALTETDEEGGFLFNTLETGLYQLRVSGLGWLTNRIEVQSGEESLEITISPGPLVFGRVVNQRGEGIGEVRLIPETGWGERNRYQTDKQGEFSFLTSTKRKFDLVLIASGYGDALVEVPRDGGDLGTVILGDEICIQGIVRGPKGNPVPRARVTAVTELERNSRRRRSSSPVGVTAWTEIDGQFSIEVLEPYGTYFLTANSSHFAMSEEHIFTLNGNSIGDAEISLAWGSSLYGQILGQDGGSLPRASVVLKRLGDNSSGSSTSKTIHTRSDGTYSISELAPGNYFAGAAAPGYVMSASSELQLLVDQKLRFDVTLEPEILLSGLVTDDSGIPIAGANIMVRDNTNSRIFAHSDPDGVFTVSGLGPGDVRLTAEAPGFLRHDSRFEIEREDFLSIVLQRAYELEGVVIDHGTGEPIRSARIRATSRESGESRRVSPQVRSDETGRFLLRLRAGDYSLRVTAEKFMPLIVEEIPVPPKPSDAFLEVLLRAGGRVRGNIYDEFGHSIEGVLIRAFRLSDIQPTGESTRRRRGRPVAQDRSNEDGSYQVWGLPDGEYEIHYSTSEHLPRVEAVTVSVDMIEPIISVGLQRGAALEGRVYSSDGTLRSSGFLLLRGPVRKRFNLREEGHYRFAGLPSGTYTVEYRGRGGDRSSDSSAQVELGPQEQRTIDLRP